MEPQKPIDNRPNILTRGAHRIAEFVIWHTVGKYQVDEAMRRLADEEWRNERPVSKLMDKWAYAEDRVAGVIARKYPDAQDPENLAQITRRNLLSLKKSPVIKFVETIVEGRSVKTVEPMDSETPGYGLPVGDVVDYMDWGNSHEFEFGVPDPEINPWYLLTLSNYLEKPIEAYLPGKATIQIQPQERSAAGGERAG